MVKIVTDSSSLNLTLHLKSQKGAPGHTQRGRVHDERSRMNEFGLIESVFEGISEES